MVPRGGASPKWSAGRDGKTSQLRGKIQPQELPPSGYQGTMVEGPGLR
jgi:hypothetical protein